MQLKIITNYNTKYHNIILTTFFSFLSNLFSLSIFTSTSVLFDFKYKVVLLNYLLLASFTKYDLGVPSNLGVCFRMSNFKKPSFRNFLE